MQGSRPKQLARIASDILRKLFPNGEPLSDEGIRRILIARFGTRCWGCGFEPPPGFSELGFAFTTPDERYLELDHIYPKSHWGSRDLHNRALLCTPCNRMKSNFLTLFELQERNRLLGFVKNKPLIDLQQARQWVESFNLYQLSCRRGWTGTIDKNE